MVWMVLRMLRIRPRQMKKETKSCERTAKQGNVSSSSMSAFFCWWTYDCSVPRDENDDVPSPLPSSVPCLTDETPGGTSDSDERED